MSSPRSPSPHSKSPVQEMFYMTPTRKPKENIFQLDFTPREFIVPSTGQLQIDIRNLASKSQMILVNLNSALFEIRYPRSSYNFTTQEYTALKPNGTMTFLIQFRESTDEKFKYDNCKPKTPEGTLSIYHEDYPVENAQILSDECWNIWKCNRDEPEFVYPPIHNKDYGEVEQNVMLEFETPLTNQLKEKFLKENRDYEKKKKQKMRRRARKESEKRRKEEMEKEEQKKGCCVIS